MYLEEVVAFLACQIIETIRSEKNCSGNIGKQAAYIQACRGLRGPAQLFSYFLPCDRNHKRKGTVPAFTLAKPYPAFARLESFNIFFFQSGPSANEVLAMNELTDKQTHVIVPF